MSGVNRVMLVGRLGGDPELTDTKGGPRASFSLATSESWRDKEGAMQERTEWHKVVVWGTQAETVAQYLHKGRQVCVEGRIESYKWTDPEGKERYGTNVVANRVTFLSDGRGTNREAGASAAHAAADRVRT